MVIINTHINLPTETTIKLFIQGRIYLLKKKKTEFDFCIESNVIDKSRWLIEGERKKIKFKNKLARVDNISIKELSLLTGIREKELSFLTDCFRYNYKKALENANGFSKKTQNTTKKILTEFFTDTQKKKTKVKFKKYESYFLELENNIKNGIEKKLFSFQKGEFYMDTEKNLTCSFGTRCEFNGDLDSISLEELKKELDTLKAEIELCKRTPREDMKHKKITKQDLIDSGLEGAISDELLNSERGFTIEDFFNDYDFFEKYKEEKSNPLTLSDIERKEISKQLLNNQKNILESVGLDSSTIESVSGRIYPQHNFWKDEEIKAVSGFTSIDAHACHINLLINKFKVKLIQEGFLSQNEKELLPFKSDFYTEFSKFLTRESIFNTLFYRGKSGNILIKHNCSYIIDELKTGLNLDRICISNKDIENYISYIQSSSLLKREVSKLTLISFLNNSIFKVKSLSNLPLFLVKIKEYLMNEARENYTNSKIYFSTQQKEYKFISSEMNKILTGLESRFFLDCLKYLKRKDIEAFTKHDSIFVNPSQLNRTMELLSLRYSFLKFKTK